MNGIMVLLGIIGLLIAVYGLLRTRWSRTKDGLIKGGGGGVYYEPELYFLRWLIGLVGAILFIVVGLVY